MTVYKHILEQNLLANVEEFDVWMASCASD